MRVRVLSLPPRGVRRGLAAHPAPLVGCSLRGGRPWLHTRRGGGRLAVGVGVRGRAMLVVKGLVESLRLEVGVMGWWGTSTLLGVTPGG